jgi:hypothetical protein
MRALLFGVLLMVGQVARAEVTLCNESEQVAFSCHVARKVVSLCIRAKSPPSLIYRFGLPGRVELNHPGRGTGEKGKFRRTSQPLYGGGMETIAFARAGHEYRIYSKVGRAASGASNQAQVPEFEDGLIVLKAGKIVRTLVCDDGGEGFRQALDWVPE